MHVTHTTKQDGAIAVLEGTAFRNGSIELDMAGAPAKGAAAEARGFVGVAFRVQEDPKRYEAFYLRPTNGRADDQRRRLDRRRHGGLVLIGTRHASSAGRYDK